MATERQIAVAVIANVSNKLSSGALDLLQPLGGKPVLHHVLDNTSPLHAVKTFVVVGSDAKEVIASLVDREHVQLVRMAEKQGTAHLIQRLIPLLEGFQGDLILMDGDMPLLQGQRLITFMEHHRSREASATIMTTLTRELTKGDTSFFSNSDHAYHLTPLRHFTTDEQKNSDINAGVSCFCWPDLVTALERSTLDDEVDFHELYKVFDSMKQAIHCVEAYQDFIRVHDKKQLAAAHKLLQKRRRDWLMVRGVTFHDPDSVTVDETVVIGENVIIEPQTHLRGNTRIGDGCCIGPGSFVENSEIGARCKVRYSVVSDCTVASGTWIGPYAHLRANSQIGEDCRVGNFVEIKNASLGKGTCAGHLSYLGDAELGDNVNIGAGTITANFDGFKKHKTTIHDGSKTGANSVLVAPVTVGSRVTIGAGSTVTEDVTDEALVVARARQVVKPDWKPKPK